MHPFPHRYRTSADARQTGVVQVTSDTAPDLQTMAPPEFGGPPGYWSPETLLIASIADCYILSFRAVARASKLEWERLVVDVEGVLDRQDGVTRFVSYTVAPRLWLASSAQESLAHGVLEKAERTCLITNSLTGTCELKPTLTVTAAASDA